MYVVETDGKRDGFWQFRNVLLGRKRRLYKRDRQQCGNSAGDSRSRPVRTLAGQRVEAVSARHAAAVMLSADAATKRCRCGASLRKRNDHAGEQKQ